MRAAKNCGRRAVLLTWWIRGPDLTVTLNGLLGHRWELDVEFLSVHHAKPRGKGVFALGLAWASQDTRIGATTPALHAAWLRAWCSMDGNLRYGFFRMGCIKVQSNDHAYGTCLCDDPRLLFKWDRFGAHMRSIALALYNTQSRISGRAAWRSGVVGPFRVGLFSTAFSLCL